MSWTYFDTFCASDPDERVEMYDKLEKFFCRRCGGDKHYNEVAPDKNCTCEGAFPDAETES